MNANIVLSFIIGGIVLLSIVRLNINMMEHSVESTLFIVNQTRMDMMIEQVERDLNRLGYASSPSTINRPRVESASQDAVTFWSDVADNGVREITWEMTDEKVSSQNSELRILRRVGTLGDGIGDNHTEDFPVISFQLTGFSDAAGTQPAVGLDDIRSILVEIVYEAPEAGSASRSRAREFPRTYYRKLFVPKNLQLTYY